MPERTAVYLLMASSTEAHGSWDGRPVCERIPLRPQDAKIHTRSAKMASSGAEWFWTTEWAFDLGGTVLRFQAEEVDSEGSADDFARTVAKNLGWDMPGRASRSR